MRSKWQRGVLGWVVLLGLVWAASVSAELQVIAVDGDVEYAAGPVELLQLGAEDRLTVRALRAFGRTPDSLNALALSLRRADIDLLTATLEDVETLAAQVRAGNIDGDAQALKELLAVIKQRDYLDWELLDVGSRLPDSSATLLRGPGRVLVAAEDGSEMILRTSGFTLDLASARFEDHRLWGDVPGIRVYGDPEYMDFDPADLWTNPRAILIPTADGGHLLAASMSGLVDLEIWVARFDAEMRTTWTRWISSPIGLVLRSGGARADGGFWLLGDYDLEHEGSFLIALNAAGQVDWMHGLGDVADDSEPGSGSLVQVNAGAGNDSAILAVGTDPESAARAVAVQQDGTPLWQYGWQSPDLPLYLTAATALDSGWVVAGRSISDGDIYVAGFDLAGKTVWERRWNPAPWRPADAWDPWLLQEEGSRVLLATLADGQVLVVAKEPDSGSAWVRILASDGGEMHAFSVGLERNGYPLARQIGALAATEDAFWLAGSAHDGHAWLAEVAFDGSLSWLNEYGVGTYHDLSALLPRAGRLTAAGFSVLEPGSELAIWQLEADVDGQLVAAPILSELGQQLQMLVTDQIDEVLDALVHLADIDFLPFGPAEVWPGDRGMVDVRLPFLSGEIPWPFAAGSGPDAEMELSLLRFTLRKDDDENWEISVYWPRSIAIRDFDSGDLIGEWSSQSRVPGISLLWGSKQRLPLRAKMDLSRPQLDLLPKDPVTDYLRAVGFAPENAYSSYSRDDNVSRIGADYLVLHSDLDVADGGLVSGPLGFLVGNVALETISGEYGFSLGEFKLEAEYSNFDAQAFAGFMDLAAQPEWLFEQDPRVLVKELITAAGGFKIQSNISGLKVQVPEEEGHFSLASAQLELGFLPTGRDAPELDLYTHLAMTGWQFRDGDPETASTSRVDELQSTLRLSGFVPLGIVDMVMAAMLTGDLDPEVLAAATTGLLDGFHLDIRGSGIQGGVPGEMYMYEDLAVQDFIASLTFHDLATEAPGFGLHYHHRLDPDRVLERMPLPAELLPREVTMRIDATGLPLGLLADPDMAEAFFMGDADPMGMALALLSANQTVLQVHEILIDLPISTFKFQGEAATQEGDGQDPDRVWTEGVLEIRNLDGLVALALEAMDERERKQAQAMVAVLKLVGQEIAAPTGEVWHQFRIRADSTGAIFVNDQDMMPLIMSVL